MEQLDCKTIESIIQRVRLRLLRFLGPKPELDDIVQSSMEQFYKAISKFRGECSLENFACSIALNVAKKHLRRKRLTMQIFDLFTEPVEKTSERTPCDTETFQKEVLKRIIWILDRISVKKRVVFCMYYFEGKNIHEISNELNINQETAKVRLFHCRKELIEKGMKDPYIKEWLESQGVKED